MARLLALAFLLSAALPAQAQLRAFADPTVSISAGSGFFSWTPASAHASMRDNVVYNVSVSAASSNWMIQGGAQLSDDAHLNVVDIPRTGYSPDGARDLAVTYRTLYAIGGPSMESEWVTAGAAIGPAVTWGTRLSEVLSPPCPPEVEDCVRTLELRFDSDRYLSLGLAGSLQGFVRLDGRLWIGAETMAIVNPSSTHLAQRLALRVDLLRPDR